MPKLTCHAAFQRSILQVLRCINHVHFALWPCTPAPLFLLSLPLSFFITILVLGDFDVDGKEGGNKI